MQYSARSVQEISVGKEKDVCRATVDNGYTVDDSIAAGFAELGHNAERDLWPPDGSLFAHDVFVSGCHCICVSSLLFTCRVSPVRFIHVVCLLATPRRHGQKSLCATHHFRADSLCVHQLIPARSPLQVFKLEYNWSRLVSSGLKCSRVLSRSNLGLNLA